MDDIGKLIIEAIDSEKPSEFGYFISFDWVSEDIVVIKLPIIDETPDSYLLQAPLAKDKRLTRGDTVAGGDLLLFKVHPNMYVTIPFTTDPNEVEHIKSTIAEKIIRDFERRMERDKTTATKDQYMKIRDTLEHYIE